MWKQVQRNFIIEFDFMQFVINIIDMYINLMVPVFFFARSDVCFYEINKTGVKRMCVFVFFFDFYRC